MTDTERHLAQALITLAHGGEHEVAYDRDGNEWLIVGCVHVHTRTPDQRVWGDPDQDLAQAQAAQPLDLVVAP